MPADDCKKSFPKQKSMQDLLKKGMKFEEMKGGGKYSCTVQTFHKVPLKALMGNGCSLLVDGY